MNKNLEQEQENEMSSSYLNILIITYNRCESEVRTD